MKLVKRYLGCIDWPGANQLSMYNLPRNYAVVAYEFELVADLTRTSTAADGGGPKDSAPAQLISSLELIANGSDTLRRIPFETLHRKNQIQFGTRPRIYSEDWEGYADAENKVLKVACRMPFAMPRLKQEVQTLLDSASLSSLVLNVQWGAGLDTMNDTWPGTGTVPVVTVNDAKLHITAIEYVGSNPETNYLLWKESWKREQVTAINNAFQIDLPFGAGINYRSILIKTHSDGDQVDTIIPYNGLAILNKISLKSGTETYLFEVAQLLQVQNRLAHAMEVPERTATAAALNHRLQELLLEGYYYIDFCRDGMLSEMLDTSRLSDLKLICEVAAPGTLDYIDVIYDHVLPAAVKV